MRIGDSMTSYLIAIDSDGTLKNNDGIISEKTKNILNKLKKDNYIVICTGRPRYHTKSINNELSLSNYIISSNGAEIFDVVNDEIIYSKYIDKELLKPIYEDAINANIRIIFVVDDTEYVTEYTKNDSQILIDDNNIKKVFEQNVKQIMLLGNDSETIKDFKQLINKKYDLSIIDSSFQKEHSWFCINAKDSNKGKAMEYLTNHLNINKDNTIAIGNDNNDISMLKYAKIGVAVENATKELLKIADYVTKSNNDEGVYYFLKQWSEDNERDTI